MAEGQSKSKDRLIEVLVLAFVIVTVGLLVVQMGMNVVEAVDQANRTGDPALISGANAPVLTVTPSGPVEPTPTFDIGSVEIKDS